MNGRKSVIAFLVSSVLLLGQMMPASATTLSLDTGKSLVLQSGETGLFTFSFTNTGDTITEDFLGWTIGLQFLPAGTTTGSLTLNGFSQPVPALNPMPAGEFAADQPEEFSLTNSGVINGTTQYWNSFMQATDQFQTVLAGQTYGLASFSFTASVEAEGVWNVYAVQQQSQTRTFWLDGSFGEVMFSNLPSAGQGNYAMTIGTITVNPVPEPSGLMLAGSAIVAAGWFGWRSRRNPMVVEA